MLLGGEERRDRLTTVEPVPLPLLLENVEVQMAIGRLFRAVEYDALNLISTLGWGSMFEAAYLCASETIQPGGISGRAELEATIYHLGRIDIKLHSLFRIEE